MQYGDAVLPIKDSHYKTVKIRILVRRQIDNESAPMVQTIAPIHRII